MEDTYKNSKDIVLYTLEGCGHCGVWIKYLEDKGYEYKRIHLPVDMTTEQFKVECPTALGFPHVKIDGKDVDDMILFFESGL
jgi:glutaredoxin